MAQTENAMLILQAGGNEAGRRWPLGRKRIVIGLSLIHISEPTRPY